MGRVIFHGTDVTRDSCAHKVKAGMTYVPAEHPVFGTLKVVDNLELGALTENSPTRHSISIEATRCSRS